MALWCANRFWSIICLGAIAWIGFSSANAQTKDLTEIQRPMLWMVEGKKPTWLFGTIHLSDKRLDKLPATVLLAMLSSDAVYTEIPMDMAQLMAARHAMQRQDGKTLLDVLPNALRERLEQHLQKQSAFLSLKALANMKTWVVSTIIAAPQEGGDPAMDIRIYQRAKKAQKEVGGLETVFEQIGYFDRFSEAEQIRMLEESLNAYEQQNINELMIQWYLKGNSDNWVELMQRLAAPNYDKALQDKFVKILLTDRNQIMADRIAAKISQNPERQYFFAVGAGHLGGENSVMDFLAKKGYKTHRVGGD